jgi:hypothetical protein
MNHEKPPKDYVIENKADSSFLVTERQRKGGRNLEDRAIMLLKTHIEKMSVFRVAIMLMKISNL